MRLHISAARARTCFTVVAMVGAAGCGDSPATEPDDPRPAVLSVTVTTTGESIDGDGYTVRLGQRTLPVDVNGTVVFDDVAPGTHTVVLEGVAPNCSIAGDATRNITASGGATSQAEFVVQCAYDLAGVTLPVIACPALAPAAVSGMPLARITIGVIPTTLQRPVARISAPDGTAATLGLVDDDDPAHTHFVVPLHGGGGLAGGEVLVRISDDERTCPPFSFRIDALPPASGEFTAIVALMQAALADQAALAGTSVAALRETRPADLPTGLLPLAVAQSVIDHPRNPNSLMAIATGTAPMVNGLNVALLDGVLARTGLRDGLQNSVAASRQAPLLRPVSAYAANAADMDAIDCVAQPIELPADLDACMRLASHAAFRMDGISDQVLTDLGLVMGAAGLIPHAGVKAVAAAAGLAMWATQKMREGTAHLLPSEFVSIAVEASPVVFAEDHEGTGDWMAEVTATSKGWSLDRVVLEGLLQLSGAASGAGAAHVSYLDRVMKLIPHDLKDDIAGLVMNQVVSEAIARTPNSEFIRIEPQVSGPVDVSDEQWSERTVVSGTSVEFTEHTAYEPRAVGVTLMQVRTRGGRFGGRQIGLDEPQPIEVKQLRLHFRRGLETVTEMFVRPGVTYPLELLVMESVHPDQVTLDAVDPARGHATLELFDESHEVRYTAPASLDALPFTLTARHVAETGARGYSTEARVAQVTIRPMKIDIRPAGACIEPGATLTFVADVQGVTDPTVSWSASIGAFSGDIYTAPNVAPGTQVTIAAVSVEQPELRGEVSIQVGGCICSYNADLTGGVTARSQGPAQFRIGDDGALTVRLEGTGPGTIGDQIHVGVTTAAGVPAARGEYPIVRASWLQVGTPYGADFWPEVGLTCPTCDGVIVVESISDEFMTGSITATLPTGLGWEELGPTSIHAAFRAAIHYPGNPSSPYVDCSHTWSNR